MMTTMERRDRDGRNLGREEKKGGRKTNRKENLKQEPNFIPVFTLKLPQTAPLF